MNIENLQNLRRLMVSHKLTAGIDTKINGISCSLNMSKWGQFDIDERYDPGTCGTTACAYGTWLLSPFNNGPHTITKDGDVLYDNFSTICGIDAAIEDFDITEDQADWLFLPSFYPDCHDREEIINTIIDRIDILIAHPDKNLLLES